MKAWTVLLILLVGAFGAGFTASVGLHGDWMVMRDGDQQCVAFDPATGAHRGPWAPRADQRCHLADFLWRQMLIGRPEAQAR